MGFANMILSHRDSQFTSGLMREISFIRMKQLFTAPYDPRDMNKSALDLRNTYEYAVDTYEYAVDLRNTYE